MITHLFCNGLHIRKNVKWRYKLVSKPMVKKVGEKSMKYGYCRVSTKGQAKEGNGLEAQEKAFREAGAEKIYLDSFTGTKTSRPELDKLLQEIQSEDTLIITKIDRFARTATPFCVGR